MQTGQKGLQVLAQLALGWLAQLGTLDAARNGLPVFKKMNE